MRLERKQGKRKQTTVEVKEIDAINRDFQAGRLPYENALALVKDLRDRLVAKERGRTRKPITNAENLKLLEAYWTKEYRYRDIEDPTGTKSDLSRAVRAVGNLALYTASEAEIYDKIRKSGLGKNNQRRVMSRLNQLLRFANRDFRLRLPRQDFPNVRYLNALEVKRLADKLEGLDKHLVILAFSTGLRLGELFALRPENLDENGHLYIAAQVKKDGRRTLPKTRRTRRITVLATGRDSLKVWLATTQKDRSRHRKYHEVIARTCRELWSDEPEKHITFHDLRHSFAIEMLRLGESLTTVAGLLGNSIQVCQTYYTGFSLKSESLEALDARLEEKFKAIR